MRARHQDMENGPDSNRRFRFAGRKSKEHRSASAMLFRFIFGFCSVRRSDHRTFEPLVYRLRFLLDRIIPKLELPFVG